MVLDAPMNPLQSLVHKPKGDGPPGVGSFVPGLLAILAQHPGAAGEGMGVLQTVLSNLANQEAAKKAQQLQNRQNLSGLLTNAAMQPGMTPEMLQGLGMASYPNITQGKFGTNALSALGNAMPNPADTVDAEDRAVIGKALIDAYGEKDVQPDDAKTLYEMRDMARKVAMGAGLSPAGQEEAANFAETIFAGLTGATPEYANLQGRANYNTAPASLGQAATSGVIGQPGAPKALGDMYTPPPAVPRKTNLGDPTALLWP